MAYTVDKQVTLGETVPLRIRSITPDDEEALRAFHSTLGHNTVESRYCYYMPLETRITHDRLAGICAANAIDEIVLAVFHEGTDAIIAIGRLNILPNMKEGETAMLVSDVWQNHHLGHVIKEELVSAARTCKLERIHAYINVNNSIAATMCRKRGYIVRYDMEDNTLVATLEL